MADSYITFFELYVVGSCVGGRGGGVFRDALAAALPAPARVLDATKGRGSVGDQGGVAPLPADE